MKLHLSRLVASLFYVGFIPGMPGTYGSILTALVFWGFFPGMDCAPAALHLGVLTLLGIAASAAIEKGTGVDDPSYIIIDEAAGQLLTFLFLPVSPLNILLGVIAFRTFDIWKPYPIRKIERLGKGVGVMADDLLAGIYGNIVLQFLNLLL
jgi:phosphatidylglycerophosphatase A